MTMTKSMRMEPVIYSLSMIGGGRINPDGASGSEFIDSSLQCQMSQVYFLTEKLF